MFLVKFFINDGLIKRTHTQINDISPIKANGSTPVRNSLKNEFDGNGPLIWVSVINQSNERNAWDDEPTWLTGLMHL